jgi:TrmH family RNA methyltransferase
MITSLQNSKIKEAVRLRERKERDLSKSFLIEGFREILRAQEGDIEFLSLFYCQDFFLGSNENALIEKIKSTHYPCTKEVFQKISYRDRPDGLLAIARQKSLKLNDIKFYKNPFLVAAESIEKPGNLGTILRSSDSVKVDCLIVCDSCTDVFNPNTVRASVGTLFTVPVAEATSQETINWLKANNIKIIAATPSGDKNYSDVDLTEGVCIAVGTEQIGLSKLWMDNADLKVKIPMKGAADSLNVAMATTILLFEVLRQRNKSSF